MKMPAHLNHTSPLCGCIGDSAFDLLLLILELLQLPGEEFPGLLTGEDIDGVGVSKPVEGRPQTIDFAEAHGRPRSCRRCE